MEAKAFTALVLTGLATVARSDYLAGILLCLAGAFAASLVLKAEGRTFAAAIFVGAFVGALVAVWHDQLPVVRDFRVQAVMGLAGLLSWPALVWSQSLPGAIGEKLIDALGFFSRERK